ncbi:MAG: rod shape-determining protein, partial [Clostridia bacterium]|nr:rod shape-determining protein [Clostridia bacterium]
PELDGDIVKQGILMTGGGSMLDGFADVIASDTGVRVWSPKRPDCCVALGAARAMRVLGSRGNGNFFEKLMK